MRDGNVAVPGWPAVQGHAEKGGTYPSAAPRPVVDSPQFPIARYTPGESKAIQPWRRPLR